MLLGIVVKYDIFTYLPRFPRVYNYYQMVWNMSALVVPHLLSLIFVIHINNGSSKVMMIESPV